jgi:hypothetical protein
MIVHVEDSDLKRCIIDANGSRVGGLIIWVNLDTGEACRFKQDESGRVVFKQNQKDQSWEAVQEKVHIPAPVSCLPVAQWSS